MDSQHEFDRQPDGGDGFRVVAGFLALAIIAVACLALGGCSARDLDPMTWFRDKPAAAAAETPEAKQARLGYAAEASAGCEAIARGYVAPSGLPEAAEGVGAFVRATAGEDRMPAPVWTVDRIATDPVAYRQAGESAERDANGTQVWFWLKCAGAAAIPVLLAFAKNVPGLGGAFAGLAEGLWKAYAPKATKQQDEARSMLAEHTTSVVRLAASVMPPGEAQRVAGRFTPEVVDALQKLGVILPAPRPTTPA